MNLPLELFYQFALHLPSTKDVLTVALANSRVRKVVLTPALFKDRLALVLDPSAWQDEDDSAAATKSPPRYLEHWMRLDYVYCRIVRLFDEAAMDNYFSKSPPDINVEGGTQAPEQEQLDPGPLDDIVTPQLPNQSPVPPRPLLDEQKAIVWLRKLSGFLPVFLTHYRGASVTQITEARYRGAVLTYARVLSAICGFLNPKRMFASGSVSGSQGLKPRIPTSEYAWLERICFCLVALLIQCDTGTITSIFSNTMAYTDPPSSAFRPFFATDNVQGHPADSDPYIAMTEARQFRISERQFSTFLIQGMIFMTLGSDTSLPLRPPSFPHINPAASFSYDEAFEMQQATSPSSLLLQPPRPWLRNRLAGTPLADLLSPADSGGNDSAAGDRGRRQWAGYYTINDSEDESGQDPPMFLELHLVRGPPQTTEEDFAYFSGPGHDGVGTFDLRCTCNLLTGEVWATKIYATHHWIWQGMVTPFGMAGIWDRTLLNSRSGWWWIWPREWSNENPTTTGAN